MRKIETIGEKKLGGILTPGPGFTVSETIFLVLAVRVQVLSMNEPPRPSSMAGQHRPWALHALGHRPDPAPRHGSCRRR